MSAIVFVTIFVPFYINARVATFFIDVPDIHEISLTKL